MKKAFLLLYYFFCSNLVAQNISGVINNYSNVSAIAGANITVGSAVGFAPGDKVLIIQMKGASISTANNATFGNLNSLNSAGSNETATITAIAGNVITVNNAPTNVYDVLNGFVQMVRVPTYCQATVNNTLTCSAWNGTTGGILAFDAGTLTLSSDINVSALGFRGGTFSSNSFCCSNGTFAGPLRGGQKGEGVFEWIIGLHRMKGKQANGGGGSNCGNSGGGGGGNGGPGGLGGNQYNGCGAFDDRGIGGLNLATASNLLFMGGGGGGGFRDNNQVATSGGNGGGIILITANVIICNNRTIASNGGSVTIIANDEGSGGGGAGGSIFISCTNYVGNLNVQTNGGRGGSNFNTIFQGNCHGPGGGGGGGVFAFSPAVLPGNITYVTNGGAAGTVNNPASACFNTTFGAAPGTGGTTLPNLPAPLFPFVLPTITAVGNNTMCSQNFNGSTNTIAIQAMGGNTYTWTNAAGFLPATGNGTNFISTAPITLVPTVGNITVVATSASGCTAQAVHDVTVIPNPALVFAPAQPTLCFGKSIPISVTGASTYVWSSGATLNTTTGSLVVASPTTNTTYTVVGSALGCTSDFHYITATVVANPTVLITSGTATMCYGSSLILNSTGATTYSWYPNSAISNTFMNSVVVNPLSNLHYTVIGEVNTCTATAVKEVTVIPLPSLQASSSKSIICSGEVATINSNGATNYQWSPVIGIIGSSTTNFISVSPVASTTYILVGKNGACTATLDVPITVVPRPELNLSTTNNKICEGNNTTIFASGSQYYIWTPSISVTPLNPNTSIVNPQVTTNYTVLGYNTIGTKTCNLTKEIEIEVVPKIIPSISGNKIICEGQSVKLTASGSNTYKWTPPAGLDVTDKPTVYANPKYTTTYTVTVSNNENCGELAFVEVKVNPIPTVSAGPDLTFNLDDPMHIDAVGSGTLTWVFGEEIYCPACPNTQIFPKTSGCYKVIAVNEFGCEAVDEVCVNVTAHYNIFIPNVFTPNNDGLNDVFTVSGTGFNKITISVFDRWGTKLYSTTDIYNGWDGTYKGAMSKNDSYAYKVDFTTLDGKKHTKTGHVTLLK